MLEVQLIVYPEPLAYMRIWHGRLGLLEQHGPALLPEHSCQKKAGIYEPYSAAMDGVGPVVAQQSQQHTYGDLKGLTWEV